METENAALKAELQAGKFQLETERSINEAQSAQLEKITAALQGLGVGLE